MIKQFTIKVPDEPGLSTFNLGLTETYTYDGPEVISALIDIGSGNLEGMNPESYNPDFGMVVDVNANDFTEVAYFIYNEYRERGDEAPKEQEYEVIEMENGDIYKKPINLDLNDHYTIIYDHEESCFVFNPKAMSTLNILSLDIGDKISKFNFILNNELSKKDLGQEMTISDQDIAEIQSYIHNASEYIKNNPELHPWKYINFDTLEKYYVPLSDNLNNLLSNYIG
jgi:hypothetical protein